MTVNRQIYPQLAAPISAKTPPIPAAKLASTEFDGKFDGGFCGTYGACRTEERLALCGWTPRRYSTSPVSRAAPYTPLDAAFQLHGRVCGYALTHRLARAVFHPSVGCVPSRLRWTHWTFALNAVGQGDIRRLILPRRAGQAPRCTIGSWAPLTVWGRSTFAAPPMPTGETLGRLRLAAACSGLRPCPKGFALWTPTLAAVRLGCWGIRPSAFFPNTRAGGWDASVSINPLSRHILASTRLRYSTVGLTLPYAKKSLRTHLRQFERDSERRAVNQKGGGSPLGVPRP